MSIAVLPPTHVPVPAPVPVTAIKNTLQLPHSRALNKSLLKSSFMSHSVSSFILAGKSPDEVGLKELKIM
jgi:hypothetical protein